MEVFQHNMVELSLESNLASKALDLNTFEVYLPHRSYPKTNLEYNWKRENDTLIRPSDLARVYDDLVNLSVIPTDRKDHPFTFVSLGSGIPTQEIFLFDYDQQKHGGDAVFRAIDNGNYDSNIIASLQRFDSQHNAEFFYLDDEAQHYETDSSNGVDIFWIQKSILYFALKGVTGFDPPKELLQRYIDQLTPSGAIVVDCHDPKVGPDPRLPTSTGQMLLDNKTSLGLSDENIHILGESKARMIAITKPRSQPSNVQYFGSSTSGF